MEILLQHKLRWGFRGFCMLMLAGLLLLPVLASAQDAQTVTGSVSDMSTGEPLPGVNISVAGTTIGTSSDAEGQFELNVPSLSDTLQFSFIGYAPLTVPLQGRSTVNVELEPTTISGEELVVVGYGTQQAQDLTGSVSVVDVDKMTQVPDAQVANQLQGQASGVTVIGSGQPGEEPQIRIRGINTFGNNEPLYVVDGVPTQNIKDLNSNDIESMQVLKDAASASIYGSRASNGVIVITTKKGRGDVTVEYGGYYGTQVPPSGNPWNILNSQEMAELTYQAIRNSGNDPSEHPQYGGGDTPVLPDYIDPPGLSEDQVNLDNYYIDPHYTDPGAPGSFYYITPANKQGTNYFDEIFDPAPVMNHDLSVSGGGDIGNYLFSFNYLDQQGTLQNQFMKRYTLRANTSFNISDNFRIGENISYSVSENPQVAALTEGSAIGFAYRQQPIIPVYDAMGNFAGTQADGLGNARNPVAIRHRTRNNEYSDGRLFGNVFSEIEFLDDRFLFRTSFGGEYFSGSGHSFTFPTYENAENSTVNQYNASSYFGYNYTWSNTLTYTQNFRDLHDVKVVIGNEVYKNKGQSLGGSNQGYFSFDPNFTNLDTGSGTQTNYSSRYEDSLFSLFGRADYNYDQRYLLSATIRRDGSSRFLNQQWGWFPSASVGWRLTNEEFFPEVSWLSDLKVRAGYGILGNQLNVDPNNPHTLYVGSQSWSYYPVAGGDGIQQGFQQSRIGNPDAKWEKNINTNIGVDAALFNNRLEITADYYIKEVKDLLYNPEVIGTAGTSASPPYVNVGNMRNSGIDASVGFFGDISENLQYTVDATFTTYSNTIEHIAQGVDYFDQEARRFGGSAIIRNAVGHPVSSFFGYDIVGFWDDQAEIDQANNGAPSGTYQERVGIGRFRYRDVNGDGEITPDDRTFLGNPNPDFTYGLNLGFNYKSFDVSMFFYGSQGNDIWNQVKWWTDFYPGFVGAKSKTALYDSWTPNNKDAKVAILEEDQTLSNNQVPNSYFVEDGSYLKLKNLQVGYSLPTSLLERVGVTNLRIYAQATNLFTATNYSGVDPEVGFYPGTGGGGSTNFGIDEGSYPSNRQFLLGINISY